MATSQESDSEWETDEETIIVAELNGLTDDFVDVAADKVKIVGIETNNPMLQLDHYIFTGQYEDIPGTMLMMEMDTIQNETAIIMPSISKPREVEQLKHVCHTGKKLVLTRAFLTERTDTASRDSAEPPLAAAGDKTDSQESADDEPQLEPNTDEDHPKHEQSMKVDDKNLKETQQT